MKKLLLIILLGMSFNSQAQFTYPLADVLDSLNNVYVGTGKNLHGNIDNMLRHVIDSGLNQLYNSIGSALGLHATLIAGDTSSLNINLESTVDSTILAPNGFSLYNKGGSVYEIAYVNPLDYGASFFLKDITTNYGMLLFSNHLSTNVAVSIPNENPLSTNYIQYHKTGLSTIWYSGLYTLSVNPTSAEMVSTDGTNFMVILPNEIQASNGSSGLGQFDATDLTINNGSVGAFMSVISGTPVLSLQDASGSTYYSTFRSGILTATRFPTTIDATGNIPIVVVDSNYSGETASMPYVNEYSFSATHTFEIGGYVDVTAIGVGSSLAVNISFTDIHGTLITQTINVVSGGTGYYNIGKFIAHAKPSTPIIVTSVLTVSTMTYDIGITITQVN